MAATGSDDEDIAIADRRARRSYAESASASAAGPILPGDAERGGDRHASVGAAAAAASASSCASPCRRDEDLALAEQTA